MHTTGICALAVIPLRKTPDSTSEIVSQLVFGDQFTIHNIDNGWADITTSYDNYRGFISEKQITFHEPSDQQWEVNTVFPYIKLQTNQGYIFAPAGCSIPAAASFELAKQTFHRTNESSTKLNLADTAIQYLNAPYLWGGKTFMGIDCSGFTQMVYKQMGVTLPRDAYQQAELGEAVSFVAESKLGDLAFFDNEAGKITHVGMMLDHERIIHASGKVRIDCLDHHGILNSDDQTYSHKLRIIKRLNETF